MRERSMPLATGSELTQEKFGDFMQHLNYHRRGEGVDKHCTADAFFTVQCKKIVSGIDTHYTDHLMVYSEDLEWFSIKGYRKDCDRVQRKKLNRLMQELNNCQFTKANKSDQWHVLCEHENHTVTGYLWEWQHVNSHFTRNAAEASIKRKYHKYRELRMFFDSQYWSWEFSAILNAISEGKLVLNPDKFKRVEVSSK